MTSQTSWSCSTFLDRVKNWCTKLIQTEPNRVSLIKLAFTLIAGCWPYFDMLLDLYVANNYYSKELNLFAGLTLVFIFLGKFISIVLCWLTRIEGEESKCSFIVKQLFTKRLISLWQVYKHGCACRTATKKGDEPVEQVYHYNMMLNAKEDLAEYSYVVTFAENLPQTILQSILVVKEMTSSPSQLVDHILPILKIASGSVSLGYSFKNGYENELLDDGHFMEWTHASALTIRNTLFIFSRILTISLLSLSSWIFLLVGILAHWTLYSAYYFFSRFSEFKGKNILTSIFHGFFLVAFFKRITFSSLSKHDATVYFVILTIENITSVFFWSSINQLASLRTFLVYLCTGSSIIGLLIHFAYVLALYPPKQYPSLYIDSVYGRVSEIKSIFKELTNQFTITDIQRFHTKYPILILYVNGHDALTKLYIEICHIDLLIMNDVQTYKDGLTNIKVTITPRPRDLRHSNWHTVTQVLHTFQNDNTDYDVRSWDLVGHNYSVSSIILHFIVEEKKLMIIKQNISLIYFPLASVKIDFTPPSRKSKTYKEQYINYLGLIKSQVKLDFRYERDKKIIGTTKLAFSDGKTLLEFPTITSIDCSKKEVQSQTTNKDHLTLIIEYNLGGEKMPIETLIDLWNNLSVGYLNNYRYKNGPISFNRKEGRIVYKIMVKTWLSSLRKYLTFRGTRPSTITNLRYNGFHFVFAVVSSNEKENVTANFIQQFFDETSRPNCNLMEGELIQVKSQYDYSTFLFGVDENLIKNIKENGLIIAEEWSARVALYHFEHSQPITMFEIDEYITEALLHYHSVHKCHPIPIQSTKLTLNSFNQWNTTGKIHKKKSDLCLFITAANNIPEIKNKLTRHYGNIHVAIIEKSSIYVFPSNIEAKENLLMFLLDCLPLEYDFKISDLLNAGSVNVYITDPDSIPPPMHSKVTFLGNLQAANPGFKIKKWQLISSQRVNGKDTYGFFLNEECLRRLYYQKLKFNGGLIEPKMNDISKSLRNYPEVFGFFMNFTYGLDELFTELSNYFKDARNFQKYEKLFVDKITAFQNIKISSNLKSLSDWAFNAIMERQNNTARLLTLRWSKTHEEMVNTILVVPTGANRLSARQILKAIENLNTSEWFVLGLQQRELYDILKLYISNDILEMLLSEPSQIFYRYTQQCLIPVIKTSKSNGFRNFKGSFFDAYYSKNDDHFRLLPLVTVKMYDVVYEFQNFCRSRNVNAVVSIKDYCERRFDLACDSRIGLEYFMNKAQSDKLSVKVVYDLNFLRIHNHTAANVMLTIDSCVQSDAFFMAWEQNIPTVNLRDNWVYYERSSGMHELGFHLNDALLLQFCKKNAQCNLKVDDKTIEVSLLRNLSDQAMLIEDQSFLTLTIYHGEKCFSSCAETLLELYKLHYNSCAPFSNLFRHLSVSKSKDNKCLIYCLSNKYMDNAFDWLSISEHGGLEQCVIVKTFGIQDVNIELLVPYYWLSKNYTPRSIISGLHCEYPQLQCNSWQLITCKKLRGKSVFGFIVDITPNILDILKENKPFIFKGESLNITMVRTRPIVNHLLKMLFCHFEEGENNVSRRSRRSSKPSNYNEEHERLYPVIPDPLQII